MTHRDVRSIGLSIVHPMLFSGMPEDSIPQTVSQIAMDGFFSAIELSHIESPAVRRKVIDVLNTVQLKAIFGAHATILTEKLDLNSLAGAEREKAISRIKELIDESGEVGANRFILMTGPDPGIEKRIRSKNLLVGSLLELCSYAQQRSISISLEPFDRSVEKRCLIGPASEALSISKEVCTQFPDFGLTYDIAHGTLLEENPPDSIRLLKDHLVHVHLGNCVKAVGHPIYGDKHPRFGLQAGLIAVPQLVAFMHALFDIGYASTYGKKAHMIGFELRPLPGETPEMIIANVKRTWNNTCELL